MTPFDSDLSQRSYNTRSLSILAMESTWVYASYSTSSTSGTTFMISDLHKIFRLKR